jgi:putative transposase
MRTRYKIAEHGQIYFTTSTFVKWAPVLISKKYFDVLIEAFRFSQENKNLKIYSYVILDNHFHLICQADKLDNIMRSIKSYSAKRIIELLKTDNRLNILRTFETERSIDKSRCKYQVWQEGYHPQMIMHDKMFKQKIDYIHYNPVKRGLVEKEDDWIYSSACDYINGKEGLIKINEF